MIFWKDAAFINLFSQVYDHYNTTLQRSVDETLGEQSLSFVFTCKTHPELHSGGSIIWPQKKGGTDGTSNLQKAADACLRKQGIECQKNTSADAIPFWEWSSCPYHNAMCQAVTTHQLCPGWRLFAGSWDASPWNQNPSSNNRSVRLDSYIRACFHLGYELFSGAFINYSAVNYGLILCYL